MDETPATDVQRNYQTGNRLKESDLQWLPLMLGGAALVAAAVVAGNAVTARTRRSGSSRGVQVTKSISILKSPAELYAFWRNFTNLPSFMRHLESVSGGGRVTHWVAKAPAGSAVEWDAEVLDERENEYIHWRSLPGSVVPNEGTVRFQRGPQNHGTEVCVSLTYDVPGGRAASLIAKLFGEEPSLQIASDLMRFKALMEAGEVLTTDGQSSARA